VNLLNFQKYVCKYKKLVIEASGLLSQPGVFNMDHMVWLDGARLPPKILVKNYESVICKYKKLPKSSDKSPSAQLSLSNFEQKFTSNSPQ
jgi:hypothetical protein